MKIKDISVVICNKNSIQFLKKTIPIYKKIKLGELMVIDGKSKDGSINYLKSEKVKIISDYGKGLSYSRKIGIKNSTKKFIFIAGPDDLCDEKFFKKLCNKFKKNNFEAANCLLKIKKPITYWDMGLNFYFAYIRKPGVSKVIGTPTIFNKNIFKKIKYNNKTFGCDDTDISEQLINNNFKIGTFNIVCDQGNQNILKNISDKFKLYGISDINYYKFKNKNHNLKNLFITYTRPLKHLILLLFLSLRFFKPKLILFIIIITIFRYKGLFSQKFKN